MAGLTPQGFEILTWAEIREAMVAALRTELGPDIDTGEDSLLGRLVGVLALRERDQWTRLQQLYDAGNPDAADGAALDNIAALCPGIYRKPAAAAFGTVNLIGTAGTQVPAGTRLRIPSGRSHAGRMFLTTATAVIGAGPTPVPVRALDPGALTVPAGTMTGAQAIVDIISGWSEVAQPQAFIAGEDEETDADLRARRDVSLQFIGAAADGAIRARLQALDFVRACIVRSNRSAALAGTGNSVADRQPPHSFWVILQAPLAADDQKRAVAETIFRAQPAGIQAWSGPAGVLSAAEGIAHTVLSVADPGVFRPGDKVKVGAGSPTYVVTAVNLQGGTISIFPGLDSYRPAGTRVIVVRDGAPDPVTAVVTDDQKLPQNVGFSFAVQRPLRIAVTITADPGYEPITAAAAVKDRLLRVARTYGMGDDVRTLPMIAAVAGVPGSTDPDTRPIPGVLGVVIRLKFDVAPGPGDGADLPVAFDELATLDPHHITVSHTTVVP